MRIEGDKAPTNLGRCERDTPQHRCPNHVLDWLRPSRTINIERDPIWIITVPGSPLPLSTELLIT